MSNEIRGIPVALPPALWADEPMPSGDSLDGMVLALDPATQTINFKRSHLACGPSSMGWNQSLIGKQDNFLWGAVGEHGMRAGLAAYIPPGVWNLSGSLVIAGPSNVEYVVRVWQGHAPSAHPGRLGIVSESPAIVGGGVDTWCGPSHRPFSIPFVAHLIQYAGLPGTANEIAVSVYPKVAGDAGAVLGAIGADETGGGYLPANFVSSFMITRVRGA